MNVKTTLFLILIAIFGATACAVQDEKPSEFAKVNCNIEMSKVEQAAPGKTVFLTVDKSGFGWKYRWSSVPDGLLSNPGLSSISFNVPESEDLITISVEVTDAQDCVAQSETKINVVAPATPSPTATNTPQPTATPTASPTPTQMPSATSTPSPTETITPSPTNTPQTVVVATVPPTQSSLAMPVITYKELLPGSALILTWEWSGQLAPEQNFAVRFWPVNDSRPEARYSITWTKEYSYEFSVAGFAPGEYLMNVAVMTGSSEGEHHEIVRSNDVQVYVPPISATDPPPCVTQSCSSDE